MNESLPTVTQEIIGINSPVNAILNVSRGDIIDLKPLILYGLTSNDADNILSDSDIVISDTDYKILKYRPIIFTTPKIYSNDYIDTIINPMYIDKNYLLHIRKDVRYFKRFMATTFAIGEGVLRERYTTTVQYVFAAFVFNSNPSDTIKNNAYSDYVSSSLDIAQFKCFMFDVRVTY